MGRLGHGSVATRESQAGACAVTLLGSPDTPSLTRRGSPRFPCGASTGFAIARGSAVKGTDLPEPSPERYLSPELLEREALSFLA